MTGRCLCGAVRFDVDGDFERMTFCHCESCKKLSGGGGTANVRAPSAAIRVTEGRELLTTYQPGEGTAKTFCSRCGTNVFGGGWPESEQCSIRITTFDEPPAPSEKSHIFVRSVAPWETLPDDGAERYDVRAP